MILIPLLLVSSFVGLDLSDELISVLRLHLSLSLELSSAQSLVFLDNLLHLDLSFSLLSGSLLLLLIDGSVILALHLSLQMILNLSLMSLGLCVHLLDVSSGHQVWWGSSGFSELPILFG